MQSSALHVHVAKAITILIHSSY